MSFVFEPGKTNLIIGESGSGKTTLLKVMIGLHEANSGMVNYNERNFTEMNFKDRKELRKEIGMLFQGGALFDYMSVQENIIFPLNMFAEKSEEENLERVNFCLNRVNLENTNHLLPSELSGGMKKRVAIARAIALNPKYLLCDEPNSGLDPKTAILIDNLIQEITEEYNITTIVNSHDMNSVMEIGDKIAFIHQGKIWWTGNKENLIASENQELNDFVFASKLFKRLRQKF
jgi:phospholipid/cholesterol/gamma-HCH transport system ATP-binding protein